MGTDALVPAGTNIRRYEAVLRISGGFLRVARGISEYSRREVSPRKTQVRARITSSPPEVID
jgi:hypothetical protein